MEYFKLTPGQLLREWFAPSARLLLLLLVPTALLLWAGNNWPAMLRLAAGLGLLGPLSLWGLWRVGFDDALRAEIGQRLPGAARRILFAAPDSVVNSSTPSFMSNEPSPNPASPAAGGSPQTLAPQEYWDQSYSSLDLFMAPPSDLLRQWIEQKVPAGQGACLELGCFPGRFLSVLGRLGYETHGIDLTPRITRDLPAWLKQLGCRVGQFAQADIWTHPFPRKYDVVASFGLIEHFPDWAKLLVRHAELVEPGGLLVVAVPNFRGAVQRGLHAWLDLPSFRRHHLPSMDAPAWERIAREQGFEILFCGPFGGFDFWADVDPQRPRYKRGLIRVLSKIAPWLRWLPNAVTTAPYLGIVARKKS